MKSILTSIIVLITLLIPASAFAHPLKKAEPPTIFVEDNEVVDQQTEPAPQNVEAKKPKQQKHIVSAGDTLSSIAKKYNVQWIHIWAMNTFLSQPDSILVGQTLQIPNKDEKPVRALPEAPELPPSSKAVVQTYSSGNTYDTGYCTWYVKNKRGDSIPNMLGNANMWYSNAMAQGLSVGSAPRAGAVGVSLSGYYGHVVFVESVNADGSVYVSEMNYVGFGVVSSRTTSASEFLYIY